MHALAEKSCVPCRPGTPPLAPDAVVRLAAEIPEWTVAAGRRLERHVRFADFASALAFVNRIGEIAERESHHPDLHLSWGAVRVEIWTHVIDGLTESDFVLAATIDRLLAEGTDR